MVSRAEEISARSASREALNMKAQGPTPHPPPGSPPVPPPDPARPPPMTDPPAPIPIPRPEPPRQPNDDPPPRPAAVIDWVNPRANPPLLGQSLGMLNSRSPRVV